jgi:ATP-binding cassette subfamily C protein
MLIYFRARKLSNALWVFKAAFPVIAYSAIFYSAAVLMATRTSPRMTTGDFLAFFAAFAQFLAAGLALSEAAVASLIVIPLIERAKPILNTLPEVDAGKIDPGELSGRIELNHLFFRYRSDMPLVLRDLSLSISAGQFVAFVGASGSGKSTIFRLLLGFEKPESGAIYFDGQDLSSLNLHAVRRQLGVVLQNGRVLTGDIFTNIVGSAPLSFDVAWEAARLSGLDGDIEAMPMGMHTMVSEDGGGFSGGQRQRLMIARAIVGKPRILLFDEATSALDNHTQAIVARSLDSLNVTRLVIAHRLSTVVNADRIFVMDKGRIVQTGSYSELIEQEGAFAELAKRQLTGFQRAS